MEAVRLKVSRYIYCHRQSVSVIGDSLSRLDGKKIWKHYVRTLPKEGSGGVRCDRGSQSFWRGKRRNNGVRQTCYLDMLLYCHVLPMQGTLHEALWGEAKVTVDWSL